MPVEVQKTIIPVPTDPTRQEVGVREGVGDDILGGGGVPPDRPEGFEFEAPDEDEKFLRDVEAAVMIGEIPDSWRAPSLMTGL